MFILGTVSKTIFSKEQRFKGNMETRAAFLSDPTYRIRLVYLPSHTSWLNQIEFWFSFLMRMRRLLKRCPKIKNLFEL